MKKHLLISFLFIAVAASAQQSVLFQDRQHLSLVLKASDAGSDFAPVFQALADGQNRPASSIELTVSFDQQLRVVRNSREQVTASFQGQNFTVDGDVFYKGFDIRSALVPGEISAVVTLRSGGNDLPPIVQNLSARIHDGATDAIDKQVSDSIHSRWSMEVSGHRFSFRQDVLSPFRDRVALVNDYYSASAEVEQLHIRLQSVNPADIERLGLQNEMLHDIEAAVGRMDSRDFDGKLGLASSDPLRFLPRLEAVRSEMLARRVAIDEARRTLFLHLYNTGLDLQARGHKSEARNYFQRSLSENPLFAPAAYQLARMDYADGCTDDASSLALDIVRRMRPDPDMYRLSVQLLDDIYDSYIAAAGDANTQKKYRQALDLIGKAKELCNPNGPVQCDNQAEAVVRTAHAGIYSSYLEESRQQLEVSHLDDAEGTVNKALDYQAAHSSYIPSGDEARAVLFGIRQMRYNTQMSVAKTHMNQQFYEKALQAYQDASKMQLQYGLQKAKDADTSEKLAARQVILAQLAQASDYVQANDLENARSLVRTSAELQQKYSLSADKAVQPKFAAIRSAIFSRECEQAQATYDAVAQQMRDAVAAKDFAGAHRKFLDAERIQRDNAVCTLDNRSLRSLNDSIIPASVYQELMQEALDNQNNEHYAEAVARMADAEHQFYDQDIPRFGLQHPALLSYASEHFRNEFLVFLGNNLRSRKDYDNSLGIYKLIIERKMPSRTYNDGLYQLGVELALRDKALQPSSNPKQKVLDYTSGDKKLKKLDKGYQKGWKMK